MNESENETAIAYFLEIMQRSGKLFSMLIFPVI